MTRARYDHGWHAWLGSLQCGARPAPRRPPAVPGLRAAWSRPPRTSGTRAPSSRRRARRGCGVTRCPTSPRRPAPTTWSGRATPTSSARRSVAMGDQAAARRIVHWLFATQQKPDGSFPQNSDVTGKPVWTQPPARRGRPADRPGPPGRTRRPGDVRARQEGGRLPGLLRRPRHRPARTVHTPGAMGEPVRLLAELHRRPDRRSRLRRRHRAPQRRRRVRAAGGWRGRRLEGPPRRGGR